jgi:hypothetical protein
MANWDRREIQEIREALEAFNAAVEAGRLLAFRTAVFAPD